MLNGCSITEVVTLRQCILGEVLICVCNMGFDDIELHCTRQLFQKGVLNEEQIVDLHSVKWLKCKEIIDLLV